MPVKFKLTVTFFLLVANMVTVFAQGISMSPTRLFFTGNPGEVVSQNVIMYNSSDSDYIFNINLKDWHREEDGTKIYFETDALENSNSLWISTLETNINLPAKSTVEVQVNMTIPEDASPSDLTNSMLFFTQIGKQKDIVENDMGIGIIPIFEFGLHIYYTPPSNNIISLEIMAIDEVVNAEAKAEEVLIRVYNDGYKVNDASVELELTNVLTGEEVKLSPINISMMPDTYQTIIHKLPDNIEGEYMGVVIIKMAGTNDLRIGEKTFEF